jgi:hypothetical protein
MRSLLDGLPPDIAQRIHADRRKNEAEYWAQQEQLLVQYRDQWVGFANRRVIVSGSRPVEVFHKAHQSGQHPFVTCVGREFEPNRMRTALSYDTTYAGEPLPVVAAEFRKGADTQGHTFDRVIADTGADASAVPWADCELLQLDPADGTPGLMGGVAESAFPTLIFPAWVILDGRPYACRLQADFAGRERILGRDVLNQMDVLFRGPAAQVVINP